MGKTVIPEGYRSLLSLYETQKAISLLKRLFEDRLAGALRLHRVSAPLFVSASSGLNDDLNGVERPVSFEINREMCIRDRPGRPPQGCWRPTSPGGYGWAGPDGAGSPGWWETSGGPGTSWW